MPRRGNPNPIPPPIPECKYDPAFCEIFVEMSSNGCSRVEFCAKVGIVYETFLKYQKQFPEFGEAVHKGLLLCQSWWEKQGRENVGNKGFNQRLWEINMTNRFRRSHEDHKWASEKQVKHSGNLDVNKQTDEELDNRIRGLMAADDTGGKDGGDS